MNLSRYLFWLGLEPKKIKYYTQMEGTILPILHVVIVGEILMVTPKCEIFIVLSNY